MGLLSFTNEIYTYLLKTPAACCETHFCLLQSNFLFCGGFCFTVQLFSSFITMTKNGNYMDSGDKLKGPTCYFAGELLTVWELAALPHLMWPVTLISQQT